MNFPISRPIKPRVSHTFEENPFPKSQKTLEYSKNSSNLSKSSKMTKTLKIFGKKLKSALNRNFLRKTTKHFLSGVSDFKYMRIITYIRGNFQKITSLSEKYRLKNLNVFHHYLIGDLASNSLRNDEKNFQKKISKTLKKLENKTKDFLEKSQSDVLQCLNTSHFSSKNLQKPQENHEFYLKTYNKLYKVWTLLYNKLIFAKRFVRKTFKVITPNSPLKIGYEIFSFFMIIFSLLFLPLQNIFWAHQNKNFVPLLLLINFFFFEIVMTLNTAYIKNGIIYTERKKIFMHSLNIHKILDFLFLYFCCETLLTNENYDAFYYEEYSHVIDSILTNILIIYKVIRMSEISIYVEDFLLNLNEKASIIIRMIKLLAFNFICAHLICCCWISISFYDQRLEGITNWASEFEIKDGDWFKVYFLCLFKSCIYAFDLFKSCIYICL